MDVSSVGRHSDAGKLGAANLGRGLAVVGAALVVLWVWTAEAADPTTPKKSRAPAVSSPAPPAVRPSLNRLAPEAGKPPEGARPTTPRSEPGTRPTVPTTSTREPTPGFGSKAVPCDERSNTLTGPGFSRPCRDGRESESESDDESGGDPDFESEAASSDGEDFEDDQESDDDDDEEGYAADGEYTEESSEDAAPSADFEELTGKIPGFTPFGGEESGGSEGSTVEGGRPWYEKFGNPGGGRPPPVDDDEE